MHPREFLALADQLAAFQVIMTGSLKKETEDAKKAIAELGSAQELSIREATIKTEEEALQNRKDKVEGELLKLKEEILAKAKQISDKEKEVDEKVAKLFSQEQASKDAANKADKATSSFDKREKEYLETTSKATNDLKVKEDKLQDALKAVAEREELVQKKLDLIKSLG